MDAQTPWSGCWDDVLATYLDAAQRNKLAGACIGIAGAGGLGSNCCLLLARCGIGKLVVVDFDVVSLSNLNRQNFLPGDIGRPKVEALADMLHAVNPGICVETHITRLDARSVPELFEPCDMVVEAVDVAETKKMLLESLMRAGKFVIGASGLAGWGGPGMVRRELGDRAVIVGDAVNGIGPGIPPLAPRVMMAASMQANEVITRILGPCPGIRS